MKTVFLNLPNKERVMRRYMCSYNAPNMLFPPQELLYLATISKEWKKDSVLLIDAIAENLNLNQTLNKIKDYSPDLLVTLSGFECFESDMNYINEIKKQFPQIKIILFGYYPTIFPRQVMKNVNANFIIFGEPDITFSELYDAIKENKKIKIKGIAYRENKSIVIKEGEKRIIDLNKLPIPDHSLIKINLYSEPLSRKPFSTIQSSRGCPFNCNYCVKSYGKQITMRSPENILQEIRQLQSLGIKNLRFIDDTFTVNKNRVQDLCRLIIKNNIKINWTCLSRIDTLDDITLSLMRKAGCKRIYLGIESGSQKVLDYFSKGYKVKNIIPTIKLIKKNKIETVGFFIIGSPAETQKEFEESVNLAKKSDLDYVIVSELIVYPRTLLAEKLRSKIKFSLFPYRNEFRDKSIYERYKDREREFYKQFYFTPKNIIKKIKISILYPKEALSNLKSLIDFVFYSKKAVEREDLF